jgi:uncharacterized protein DUF4953
MRLLHVVVAGFLIPALAAGSDAPTGRAVTFAQSELGEPFLLQVSYEQRGGSQAFNTSRSRIVAFQRQGAVLQMLDVSDTAHGAAHVLTTIPVRSETRSTLDVDLNDGFDTIDSEEDRTGEDYYGRIDRHDGKRFRLFDRKALSVSYHNAMLVFDQAARTDDSRRIVVHYYLSRYLPRPGFDRFEMKNLRRFGFYETYPQWRSGRWVLYAMKFDAHEPVVFALSSAIPARYRSAVRDGVLYWNQALGKSLLRVIDAPAALRAPRPDYNIIQWVPSGDYGSTSYIQSDPLTGQILHAHIFVLPETMMNGDLEQQADHLRYIIAHEVGHALGLRHNFAPGEATTVMDYFMLPQVLRVGRDIRAGAPALPYDTAIIRHVYLGAPLDVDSLPPFCTDDQQGCMPFRSTPKESEGIRGRAPSNRSPEH